MKKVLFFSALLIFIGNYLSAQAVGDYRSIGNGTWTTISIWQRYNGTGFVLATEYPGQTPGTGHVSITGGDLVTLNVSPLHPIGSLTISGGSGTTRLTISNTFILNVDGEVVIGAATGASATKSIVLGGATAQLNAESLAILPSNNNNKTSFLQINGSTVDISGDVVMAATAPLHQRTLIQFPGGGTLNVGGDLTGGTINNLAGIATTTINATSFEPVDLAVTNIGATLQLNSNTTVTGRLTLTNGKIDIGANTLTLSNSNPNNQLTGGSSLAYVYTTSGAGRLVRENLAAGNDYTFPVGTPTATFYMPVIVNTAAGISEFSVSVYSPATTNATVGGPVFSDLTRIVNAMWLIERTVGTGITELTLEWVNGLEGATFAGLANGEIGISRNDGVSWLAAIQTSADAAGNTATADFSAFGAFVVADIGVALPVKFGPIKAYEKLTGIQVDWKVYSEDKVKNYEIERSADGRSFTTVGTLPALYNNTRDGDYGFFDASPLPGISYYRIKNNDLDGKSAYSIIVRVNRNKAIKGLNLYPNPVLNRIVTLQGSDLSRGNYKISIFAANGQAIYMQQFKHNGGTISQTIELPSTISKGVYMLSLRDENGDIIFNEKLVNQ